MAALDRFRAAFPGQYDRKVSYDAIVFEWGARIYFRRSSEEQSYARILSSTVEKFPNGTRLKAFLEENNVPISLVKSHPDYMIGPAHWDGVVRIIQDGL